jgi:hypothetical protein
MDRCRYNDLTAFLRSFLCERGVPTGLVLNGSEEDGEDASADSGTDLQQWWRANFNGADVDNASLTRGVDILTKFVDGYRGALDRELPAEEQGKACSFLCERVWGCTIFFLQMRIVAHPPKQSKAKTYPKRGNCTRSAPAGLGRTQAACAPYTLSSPHPVTAADERGGVSAFLCVFLSGG